MVLNEISTDKKPLVEHGHLHASVKARGSYRQYLLEFIFFTFMVSYLLADFVCYQYMYDYASKIFHFDASNFSSNLSLCDDVQKSPGYEIQQKVVSYASSWQLYFALTSGIPGLFFGVLYGTYTDKIGRRFLMVISTMSVCLRTTAYLVAVEMDLSLFYVIPGYLLEGIGGSYITLYLAGSAYTADVTHSGKSRTLRLFIVFTAAGLAEALGSFISGYAIGSLGYKNAFIIILGGFGLTIFGVALLPESRSGRHMEKMDFGRYICRAFRFYTKKSDENPQRFVYILCGLSLAFATLSTTQRSGIEVLYLKDSPFCWSTYKIGNFKAIGYTIQRMIGVIVLVGSLRCINEEIVSIIFGAILCGSFVLEAVSGTDLMMYMAAGLAFPSDAFKVLQRTMASSVTDVDSQGALFASIQVIDSLCNTAGTVLSNLVYEQTMKQLKGAVFLYMGGLAVISTGYLCILLLKRRHSEVETKSLN